MAKKAKRKPRTGKVPQTTAFCFRAECMEDIVNLLAELKVDRCLRIEITPARFNIENTEVARSLPDRECTLLVVDMTQKQILDAMNKVADGHVMAETLMPLGAYDGERRRSKGGG